MKNYRNIILSLGVLASLAACSEQEVLLEVPVPEVEEPLAQIDENKVLLVAGAANEITTTTRATTIPYMGDGGRFVCRMYYIGDLNGTEYDSYNTAWLRVDGEQRGATTTTQHGNSLYWNNQYTAASSVDSYGFDKNATCFYWQNRKDHAFLAITDLHRAYRSSYVGGTDQGTLKMDDANPDYELEEKQGDVITKYKANAYDLRHWEWKKQTVNGKETMVKTQTAICSSFEDQPDVAQALTIMQPKGSTQEANRVELIFNHCFAQVQVNVQKSPDNSVNDLTAERIEKVELLGVSETGYVFYELNKEESSDGKVVYKPHSVAYEPVHARDYTAEWWSDNPNGTAMEAYRMAETATGALKSFNCIAFGRLKAIRIYWREPIAGSSEGELHVATREVEEKYVNLQSGTKYVFNIAMRRGTLAVLQADIIKWETDDTSYSGKGTINE